MRPPIQEYAARKTDRAAAAAARERVHVHLGNAKVAIFIVTLIYTAATIDHLSSTIFGAAIALFVVLAVWHEFVMRALAKAQAAVTYYADGEARIEDRWMRDTPSGERFRSPAALGGDIVTGRDHPYADDLDMFGPRSLFQLVSSCRTPMGEERLARWLLHASPVAEIRERQTRIAALRGRIDLRERIAVVNAGLRRSIHAERLIAWSEHSAEMPPLRILVVLMALLFIVALAIYMNGGTGWFLVAVPVVNLGLLGWLGKRANGVVENLAAATESAALDLFGNVIREIERESIDQAELATLTGQLQDSRGRPASRGVARLARISDWADSRHNVFLRLSEIPLLFTLQVAYAAESWRAHHGRQLRGWVGAVGEIEALLSLSGYSFEHPADPFAEIVETGPPLFDATEIAHPLLPAATAVSNSLTLGSSPRILIVSGSNMAGKSTLMRTVGINVVMALAGAPVRAGRLRLTPLALGTCLRHTDSLQEHRSGFYTEALRIRLICDLLDGPLPLLFLFDELLSGTNSKDRRVAAEGVVRTMLSRGAMGMVTTHDLSLTEIAAIFPGDVRNVHLQDKVENGQMSFDYKLRDGVITHSNALELMRMIGLEV